MSSLLAPSAPPTLEWRARPCMPTTAAAAAACGKERGSCQGKMTRRCVHCLSAKRISPPTDPPPQHTHTPLHKHVGLPQHVHLQTAFPFPPPQAAPLPLTAARSGQAFPSASRRAAPSLPSPPHRPTAQIASPTAKCKSPLSAFSPCFVAHERVAVSMPCSIALSACLLDRPLALSRLLFLSPSLFVTPSAARHCT